LAFGTLATIHADVRRNTCPLVTLLGVRMDVVYPVHLLRRLGRRDIEIDNDRLLVIAYDDTAEGFILASINLLMGNERWHVDEVSRPSFGNEFKTLPTASALGH
jgi:hypothetical protein